MGFLYLIQQTGTLYSRYLNDSQIRQINCNTAAPSSYGQIWINKYLENVPKIETKTENDSITFRLTF